MSNYRHVCFEDLKNYFKIADYFGNLSESEKQLIRENLQVPSIKTNFSQNVIYGTYEEIKQLADLNNLIIYNKYIITDFQTIYQANNGEVWGYTKNPSKIYSIILTPTSNSTFDKRVSLLHEGISLNWEACYDFTQEILKDGTKTKGKITYLKDQNNNSAYYDFKNYQFLITLKNSEVPGLAYDTTLPMYTFNKLTGTTCVENSDSYEVFNNHFDEDCWVNVFIGETNNNTFFGGFKNNIFIKGCTYNKFEWNMTNNVFLEKISYTQGSVQNAYVKNTNYDSNISKEFKMVHTLNTSEPVFIVSYLDGETLTQQVIKLTN